MKYSANSVWENKDAYDIVVVGAGHAGCHATRISAVPQRGTWYVSWMRSAVKWERTSTRHLFSQRC